MDVETECTAESWKRLEATVGGRFRDGAECPPLARLYRFAFDQADGLVADDSCSELREHIEVCPICRLSYRAARAVCLESDEGTPSDRVAGSDTEGSGQQGTREAEQDTRISQNKPIQALVPPDQLIRPAIAPGGLFAMRAAAPTAPHGANCWLIGFADDAAAVRRRIAEHAFGDPEHRFEIRIYRLPVPGRTDLVQAQFEIEPVPTKNDLELVVEFRVGGKRQFRFEVPPELRRDPTAEPRPRTRTAPSEPLPAAAFDLQGGSEWRDDAWPVELIFR